MSGTLTTKPHVTLVRKWETKVDLKAAMIDLKAADSTTGGMLISCQIRQAKSKQTS